MRHKVFGRKLGRTKDQRKLLFRNLVEELILRGRIKTTIAKAKAVKPLIDKLVTKAKRKTLADRREVLRVLPKEAALSFFDTIVPQLQNRTSGFSRIIHLGERKGDNAEMVVLEWAEQISMEDKQSLRSEELRKLKIEDRKKKEVAAKEPEEPKGKKKKVIGKRKVVNKA